MSILTVVATGVIPMILSGVLPKVLPGVVRGATSKGLMVVSVVIVLLVGTIGVMSKMLWDAHTKNIGKQQAIVTLAEQITGYEQAQEALMKVRLKLSSQGLELQKQLSDGNAMGQAEVIQTMNTNVEQSCHGAMDWLSTEIGNVGFAEAELSETEKLEYKPEETPEETPETAF